MATLEAEQQDWPYLDEALLIQSRSFQICLTCTHFRAEEEEPGWPLLVCLHHRGLLASAYPFSRCCLAWSLHPDETLPGASDLR